MDQIDAWYGNVWMLVRKLKSPKTTHEELTTHVALLMNDGNCLKMIHLKGCQKLKSRNGDKWTERSNGKSICNCTTFHNFPQCFETIKLHLSFCLRVILFAVQCFCLNSTWLPGMPTNNLLESFHRMLNDCMEKEYSNTQYSDGFFICKCVFLINFKNKCSDFSNELIFLYLNSWSLLEIVKDSSAKYMAPRNGQAVTERRHREYIIRNWEIRDLQVSLAEFRITVTEFLMAASYWFEPAEDDFPEWKNENYVRPLHEVVGNIWWVTKGAN